MNRQEALETLREKLIALQTELRNFLEQGAAGRKPVELDEPIGRVSRGDALQQQQMALANSRQVKQRLEMIKHALERFENGEFGICCECGEEISIKRLEAIPEATLCIDCKA